MKLNPLFADGMILQAGKPVRVFGTGGGDVKIEFLGNTREASITATSWMLEFPASSYGGPYEMKVTLSGREKVIRDIYIGDVYLAAGQSNMQFKLKESETCPAEYRTDSLVRLFSTERMEHGEAFFPEDGWVMCDAETAGEWSCIGYHVANMVREKKGTAVGIVTLYQGAAAIQSFLPKSVFEEDPSLVIPTEERFDTEYVWNEGTSVLYDYMMPQIAPFSFGAVLYYQGESNWSRAESRIYGKMLKLLVESWRKDLLDEELPFVIVQIADFIPRQDGSWCAIQDAQAALPFRMKNVSTVECRDICEPDLIHPKKKTELSRRIAGILCKQ